MGCEGRISRALDAMPWYKRWAWIIAMFYIVLFCVTLGWIFPPQPHREEPYTPPQPLPPRKPRTPEELRAKMEEIRDKARQMIEELKRDKTLSRHKE